MLDHILVTPERAQQWLTQNAFEGQRRLRENHVAYLAELMQMSLFREGTVISFGVVGAKHYLVNGYHTLSAIVKAKRPYVLKVEDIPCKDAEALADLYGTFDRGLQRSHQDTLSVYAVDKLFNITRAEVNASAAAIGYIVTNFTMDLKQTNVREIARFKSAQIRYEALLQYRNGIETYWSTQHGCTAYMRTVMQRVAVCAVGIAACHTQPAKGYTFFRQVAMQEDLHIGMPSLALVKFLQATKPVSIPQLAYIAHVAWAWNAYYGGRELKMLRPSGPITLAGFTPYKE